jgi:hypothetical protein
MNKLLEETVIEEFLEDQPRAQYWQELTDTLKERLKDAVQNGDVKRAEELRGHIHVLAQEAAITKFVEDSVRHSLARPRPLSMESVGEDFDDFDNVDAYSEDMF